MKKYEKTSPLSSNQATLLPKNSFLKKLNVLKFLPQILQIIPKLSQNFNFLNKEQQKPPEKTFKTLSENQKYALKSIEKHKKLVQELKKSPKS